MAPVAMKDLINAGWRVVEERTLPALAAMWRSRQPVAWLLAVVIGVAGGYGVLGLRYMIGLVQWLWLGAEQENIVATLASFRAPWLLVAAPTLGGVVVGVVLMFFTDRRRALGIADIVEARALHNSRIPLKDGLLSAAVAAVSLGAGASAGREGPAVHLGATVAAAAGSRFALPAQTRRTLLGCGAAAAVSASFNAPVAAVLFAHEVILGHYALSAFVPTVLSSVIATVIARAHLGDFPAFVIPQYHIASYLEFPAFALLGVVCGLVAVGFLTATRLADRVARMVDMPLWARPVVGGFIVGLIALALPEVLGVGYEATNLALREKYTLAMLFALLFAKTAATSITLASRFGGGVFSPSLYLGAMAGGAFGIIAAALAPDYASPYGVYAILGMGAVAGAVLGAPISTTLIVFELTGGYEMTIALLLSVSIASMIMQTLVGQSFFEWQLSTRGLYFGEGPHRRIMQAWKVRDFLTPLSAEEKENPPEIFTDRPVLTTEDTLGSALRAFNKGSFTRIAVFDAGDRERHVGWADYTKALKAYNDALVDAHIEEHN